MNVCIIFIGSINMQIEPTLATAIQENLEIPCRSDETIREISRGIRLHFNKYIKPLGSGVLEQAQLGLGHAYSRAKVKIDAFHGFIRKISRYRDILVSMMIVHDLTHCDDLYVSTFTLT